MKGVAGGQYSVVGGTDYRIRITDNRSRRGNDALCSQGEDEATECSHRGAPVGECEDGGVVERDTGNGVGDADGDAFLEPAPCDGDPGPDTDHTNDDE